MHRILFVCYGNICRSPMAEYIMKDLVKKRGMEDLFEIASAAVSDEERGNPVYPPAAAMLKKHGISCKGHRAHRLRQSEYEHYDRIIAMDRLNLRILMRMTGGDPDHKVSLLLSYAGSDREIDDPWYTDDFDTAWNDICAGCTALLEYLSGY